MDKFSRTPERLYTTSRGGYITLISVLVVGAVGVSVTVSLLLLGIGATRVSSVVEESALARGFADACAEDALGEIHSSAVCAGGGVRTFVRGSCASTVSSAGATCVIASAGTVGTVVRRTKVILSSVTPAPVVLSWREVADF